jgi:hypothetical protein
MHALFHVRTVVIPRFDIGRGMTTVLIWKKACINVFITHFNIELKKQNELPTETPNLWI